MAVISTIVDRFTPPGNVQDLNEEQKKGWSEIVNGMFEDSKAGYTEFEKDGKKYIVEFNVPRPQFFNPATTEAAPDLIDTKREIAWIGFPKKVKLETPTDKKRWEVADSTRHVQDEYCEWSVTRNEKDKIVSVTFTCEGPEYWEYLGQTNPEKVLELYQKYVNPNVRKEDLFIDDQYIPQNKWNRDTKNGAMHLIQRNNTLGAEVELAAGSSIVREIDGQILTEQQELIECGQYGNKKRNSDPFIGAKVNELARNGAMIALKDPVGLYFDDFTPTGWEMPDSSDPKQYWKILRGDPETPVRAVFEIPSEKGFVVGDIKIKGKDIEYGGQIADFVRIKLVGIAQNIGKTPVVPLKGCFSYHEAPPTASITSSIASLKISSSELAKPIVKKPFSSRFLAD